MEVGGYSGEDPSLARMCTCRVLWMELFSFKLVLHSLNGSLNGFLGVDDVVIIPEFGILEIGYLLHEDVFVLDNIGVFEPGNVKRIHIGHHHLNFQGKG